MKPTLDELEAQCDQLERRLDLAEARLRDAREEDALWGKVLVWVVTGLAVLLILQTIFRKL